jgi:glycosyltransferase involved in cell wall biosynthesis
MRILHVIQSMDPKSGGPSQGIRNLDKAMHDHNIIREVVCLDREDAPYLTNERFIVNTVGGGVGVWKYSAGLLPWLLNNITRFDIVIINGLWSYHSYATWKAIRKLKESNNTNIPRVLVMPHGMLDPYFQKAKERRLKAIRNWIYWKLIEGNVVNDADGLLFTCETELLLARKTFNPYNPKKEYNAGYGIEAAPAYNSQMKISFKKCCPGLNGSSYLLFLSRIHPKKGVDILIKAYAELYKRYSAIEMPKLVIAGPGLDTSFGEKVQRQLSSLPEISRNIFFPGMLSGDAKWGAFYGCEAFILPSHQENFGIAVAEALSCRKPVLISNQINIWYEVFKGQGGLVEDDSIEGTKILLNKWINLKDDKRKEMSNNAFNTFKTYFTTENIIKNYLSAFTDHLLDN